jgi:hypothetical protein
MVHRLRVHAHDRPAGEEASTYLRSSGRDKLGDVGQTGNIPLLLTTSLPHHCNVSLTWGSRAAWVA